MTHCLLVLCHDSLHYDTLEHSFIPCVCGSYGKTLLNEYVDSVTT